MQANQSKVNRQEKGKFKKGSVFVKIKVKISLNILIQKMEEHLVKMRKLLDETEEIFQKGFQELKKMVNKPK